MSRNGQEDLVLHHIQSLARTTCVLDSHTTVCPEDTVPWLPHRKSQLPKASCCFKVYYIYFGSYFIKNLGLTMCRKRYIKLYLVLRTSISVGVGIGSKAGCCITKIFRETENFRFLLWWWFIKA